MFRERSAGHSSPKSRARLLGGQTCDACSFFFFLEKTLKQEVLNITEKKQLLQVTIIVPP